MKRSLRRVLLGVLIVLLVSSVVVAQERTLHVQMIATDDGYRYLTTEFIPKFEAEHGVTVQLEMVDWGNRMDKLMVNTLAGNPPDLFFNGATHVQELVEAGLLHPIDEYLAAMPDLDDFFPPTLGSSTFQGHHYGLPVYTSPRVFWYRQDFFEMAGLDPNRPPASWDELIEYAKRLTVTEGNVVVRQGIDLGRWTGSDAAANLQEFVMYLAQNGGRLYDPETYEAEFDGPLGVETLEFMIDLRHAVQPPGYTLDVGGGQGHPLVRGVSAMRVDPSTSVRHFHNNPALADEIRAIVPPPGKSERVTLTFDNWLGIHSGSRNKDLAWEFLKAFTSAEVQRDFNLAAGYQSPRRSTFMDFVAEQPLVRYAYETLNYAIPFPVLSIPAQARQTFNQGYMAVMRGDEAPRSALAEAARIWNMTVR